MFLSISHDITRALCLMLVHSLWQGFLAAVIAGIIILCTRKSRVALRYNLLMLDLLLFLTLAGVTFWHEFDGSAMRYVSRYVSRGKVIVEETKMLAGIQMDVPVSAGRSATLMSRISRFLNRHSSTIVLIWMFCLLGQLVRLTGGLYQMGRLRRYRVFAPDREWKERLSVLMAQLSITKRVELLQSGLISVPVTFGFLKPTILVPLGMLANLPPDQVETILLHELAHISRNDYMTNLILHVTEAIFFFNPGIRWIASLLRDEREACCDDVVLQRTENRNNYFDALVAFREFTVGRQAFAMRLSEKKTDLLWRIRRMLNQENKNLRFMEKAILSFGLTAILVLCLVTLRADVKRFDRRKPVQAAGISVNDTIPAVRPAADNGVRKKVQFPSITTSIDDNGTTKKFKIDATDADGNTFKLTKVNGDITELIINGKEVPKKDFDQYLYIFEEIENRSHLTAHEQEGEDNVEAAQREVEKAQERLDAANREQDEVAERKERKEQEKQEALEKAQEALEQARQDAQDKAAQQEEELEEKLRVQQDSLEQRTQAMQEENRKKWEEEYEKQRQTSAAIAKDDIVPRVIDDIIGHGLANSQNDIHSFRLDSNGLTVNGKKVAADVAQEFMEKYLKSRNQHILYVRNSGGGIHTEVITEN